MPVKAGYCTAGGELVWRAARHGRTGEEVIIWPDPASVYATCETSKGSAPGIAFCLLHAPAVGDTLSETVTVRFARAGRSLEEAEQEDLGPVVDLVPAPMRYGAWYERRFLDWLSLWLKDHLELNDPQIRELVTQWTIDAAFVRDMLHG